MTYMTPSATYQLAIDRFFTLLDETDKICKKQCANQYGQERHFYVSYHPEIEARNTARQKSYDRMKEHFSSINQVFDAKKMLRQLFLDVKYLAGCPFNNLFMQILTGKLNKHFLMDRQLIFAMRFHMEPFFSPLSFLSSSNRQAKKEKPHNNLLEVLDIPKGRCK